MFVAAFIVGIVGSALLFFFAGKPLCQVSAPPPLPPMSKKSEYADVGADVYSGKQRKGGRRVSRHVSEHDRHGHPVPLPQEYHRSLVRPLSPNLLSLTGPPKVGQESLTIGRTRL